MLRAHPRLEIRTSLFGGVHLSKNEELFTAIVFGFPAVMLILVLGLRRLILWLDDREFVSADKLRATVVMFASIAVILLPVAIWQAPANDGWWRVYLSPGVSVMLLVLIGASTLVAYTLMNVWQPHLQPTHAGLIYCAEPVFASLYALFAPALLAHLGAFIFPLACP